MSYPYGASYNSGYDDLTNIPIMDPAYDGYSTAQQSINQQFEQSDSDWRVHDDRWRRTYSRSRSNSPEERRHNNRRYDRKRSYSRSRSRSRSNSRGYRRRRRSRSRTLSCERSGSYRRTRSRSPQRRRRGSPRRSRSKSSRRDNRSRTPLRYRSRSRSPQYRRRSPIERSLKVMLINLPLDADRDNLNILIAKQGFHPIDIRIVRRNLDTGALRVFGFVEFSTISQAEEWIQYNEGYLTLDDGFRAKMEFSREMDSEKRSSNPPQVSSDWTCAKCTINNFNRRTNCFKCGTSRQESDALEAKGYALVGVTPCDTLLIRELPISATEDSIRQSLSKYTGVVIQRIHISASKGYALVQMKSMEDASYMLSTFNKVMPYIDNCAVIVTFSRQSLNQILIMDNVNLLKSQSGISSVNIQEDPTNSAAQLAHNALQMIQMGKQNSTASAALLQDPTPQSVSTPFGYLQSYATPNPQTFQLEPVSGYYYDSLTGFYYDSKTEYFYNSKSSQWMFWSSKYGTYIPCEGGDQDLKKRLQADEKNEQKIRNAAVISASPKSATTFNNDQAIHPEVVGEQPSVITLDDNEEIDRPKPKKKHRKEEKDDLSKPKSALDIQREMNKWARRQEKVKVMFKGNTFTSDSVAQEPSTSATKPDLSGQIIPNMLKNAALPWTNEDDDDNEEDVDSALLPGKMRNVGLPLNAGGRKQFNNEMPHHTDSSAVTEFNEEMYLDRTKFSCLLCRRQFANMETLNKHAQLSDLHKSNLAAKQKEFQREESQASALRYRDRAKERRQLHGYDASGLAKNDRIEPSSEELASHKAKTRLDETNIGNRMLKSMGWTEGKGLGRNAQGIVEPVVAEQRVQGVGLGASGSKLSYAATRKERLKQAAIQRFQDIND